MADSAPHRPVLLDETCELISPAPGGWYLDGTVGAGGHAEQILVLSQPDGKLIGIDRDLDALAIAAKRLERFGDRVILEHANFTDAAQVLARRGVNAVHGIILDLGLSSIQVDAPDRGFSFRFDDAPLDMRADPTTGPTAAQLLARVSERDLANVLYTQADEFRSRRIAKAICLARRREPIRTAGRLAEIVAQAVGRRGKIHPATRSFMALRMWVNDELPNLEATLSSLKDIVEPGGRAVVISFHSKEDRVAKVVFREQAREGVWTLLTKKPVVPGDEERRANPRARSAKLRAVERNISM
jgi:16S rRNA (cytosine1402-N4)-methyltransferase